MPYLIAIAQLVINLATAALVPALFLKSQLTISLFGIDLPIYKYAVFGMLAYALANAWSAKVRPGGEAFYQLDLWPSLAAFLFIGGTAIAVWGFGTNRAFVDGLDLGNQLLIALTAVALYDVLVNQRRNAYEMIARMMKLDRRPDAPAPSSFTRYDSPDAVRAAAQSDDPRHLGNLHADLLIDRVSIKRGDRYVPLEDEPRVIEHTPAEPSGMGESAVPPRAH